MDDANDITRLMEFADSIDELLIKAEPVLKKVAAVAEGAPADREQSDPVSTIDVSAILDEFLAVEAEIEQYSQIFTAWDKAEITPFQRSEVTRSQGQLKRLTVLTTNIIKLSRSYVGVKDEEAEQAELMAQILSGQHFLPPS